MDIHFIKSYYNHYDDFIDLDEIFSVNNCIIHGTFQAIDLNKYLHKMDEKYFMPFSIIHELSFRISVFLLNGEYYPYSSLNCLLKKPIFEKDVIHFLSSYKKINKRIYQVYVYGYVNQQNVFYHEYNVIHKNLFRR